MGSILLLSIVYDYHDPVYAIFGFILMIIIVVLAIREKVRKPKQEIKAKTIEKSEHLYLEKDVLGLDKTYTNYNEPTYKVADKSKFKFIIFIVIFFVGLFLAIVFTPKKYAPYQKDDTITIEELQNWDQPDEFKESD